MKTLAKMNPNGVIIITPANPKINKNCFGIWYSCKFDEFLTKKLMIKIIKQTNAKINPIIVIMTIGLCNVICDVIIFWLNVPVIKKLVNGSKINQFKQ